MQIGIHAPNEVADRGWVREIVRDAGFTWTKFSGPNVEDYDDAALAQYDDMLEWAAGDLGLKIIIDLRTSTTGVIDTVQKWRAEGRSYDIGDVLSHLTAGTGKYVKRWQHLCQDWEFWGEYPCPFVSGMGGAGMTDAYPAWLKYVAAEIREADPQARVWNGGYGCDMNDFFLKGLIQDGAVGEFDVLNWHHYNMTNLYRQEGAEYVYTDSIEDRVAYSTAKYDELLAGARELLTEAGGAQPFVSSEWGQPIVRDKPEGFPPELCSMVFENVVPAFDSEGAVFVDSWLECFERHEFEVVCWHNLMDAGPMAGTQDSLHWGRYCGLFFEDGTPKQVYDVVRKWARKGGE